MTLHRRIFLPLILLVGFGGAVLSACVGQVRAEQEDLEVSKIVSSMLTTTLAATETPSPQPAMPISTATTVPSPAASPTFTPTAGPECQDAYCVYPGHFYLQRPVTGVLGDSIDLSYRYGDDQNGTRESHTGVEFPAQYGEPVFAAADGKVIVAGDDSQTSYNLRADFYGNLVIVEHYFAGYAQPVYTLYAHLSQVSVITGQDVLAGAQIGAVGETGWANGPHLHFEVRVGDYMLEDIRNPELWLIPHTTELGILNGAVAVSVSSLSGADFEINSVTLKPLDGTGSSTYYMEPYTSDLIRSDDVWQESFAMGDIPAGNYQWKVVAGGKLLTGVIPVQPGKVTVIEVEVE